MVGTWRVAPSLTAIEGRGGDELCSLEERTLDVVAVASSSAAGGEGAIPLSRLNPKSNDGDDVVVAVRPLLLLFVLRS